jgi:hypothetical protein
MYRMQRVELHVASQDQHRSGFIRLPLRCTVYMFTIDFPSNHSIEIPLVPG